MAISGCSGRCFRNLSDLSCRWLSRCWFVVKYIYEVQRVTFVGIKWWMSLLFIYTHCIWPGFSEKNNLDLNHLQVYLNIRTPGLKEKWKRTSSGYPAFLGKPIFATFNGQFSNINTGN
jgi:hypothetical protein